MKATCPNNPEHKRFVTTAHVMQEWLVDETGDFVDVVTECLDVSHRPSGENLWTCQDCEDDPEIPMEQKPVHAEVS